MFLDSLCGDAAWRGRYARDRDGKVVPWEVLEEELCSQRLLDLAAEVEASLFGGPSPRPITSIPHIISDEASCYYHGYVLAEMSVHQTRAHFLAQGPIVDNPAVGPALTEKYWQPGNSAMFLDLVRGLTGKPLTGDAWVAGLKQPLEEHVLEERAAYDEAVKAGFH